MKLRCLVLISFVIALSCDRSGFAGQLTCPANLAVPAVNEILLLQGRVGPSFGQIDHAQTPAQGHPHAGQHEQPGSPAATALKTTAPNYAGLIAEKLEPTRTVIYKNASGKELRLDVFEPKGAKSGDRRACFVAIHGGGWTAGSPRSMYAFTAHYAELGMLAVSVQYRLYKPGTEATVFDCVKDARSAVRYLRAHAAEFGIDPRRIVLNGASAGGHLAVATALLDVDEAGEDTNVSCMPNALVLFSSVIDTSPGGYGSAKIGPRWRDLSPAHQVRAGMPPTLLFHGTGDATTPFAGAQLFHDAMLKAGNRCELVAPEGAQHTYMFKDPALYADTLQRTDEFLVSTGFLPGSTN